MEAADDLWKRYGNHVKGRGQAATAGLPLAYEPSFNIRPTRLETNNTS